MASVLRLLALACVVIVLANTANATLITSGSTTLFYDDFESASELSTLPAPDATVDADPNRASSGAWSVSENPSYLLQVTNSTTSPDPGAFEGNNYLRFIRESGSGPRAYATFAEQSEGVVHAEFMMYFGAMGVDLDYTSVVIMGHSTDGNRSVLATDSDDLDIRYKNGSDVYGNTGLKVTPGTWQKWEIDVDLTNKTFDFTLDGAKVSGLAFNNSDTTTLDRLSFSSTDHDSRFYVDAVPEPASMVLLTLAVVGVAVWARRRG